MAKQKDSEYFPGARTKQWLKIKVDQWVEGIIAGYTKAKESSRLFRRLLIAVKVGEELRYIGAVGTGFYHQVLKSPDLPDHLVGEAPLIVVPGHYFHQVAVHNPRHFQVDNSGEGTLDDV